MTSNTPSRASEPPQLLRDTGNVYVTDEAAAAFAAAAGLLPATARRRLTMLLLDARRIESELDKRPERWRLRSRAERIDIGAHVAREDGMAVVVHVHVREYRPR